MAGWWVGWVSWVESNRERKKKEVREDARHTAVPPGVPLAVGGALSLHLLTRLLRLPQTRLSWIILSRALLLVLSGAFFSWGAAACCGTGRRSPAGKMGGWVGGCAPQNAVCKREPPPLTRPHATPLLAAPNRLPPAALPTVLCAHTYTHTTSHTHHTPPRHTHLEAEHLVGTVVLHSRVPAGMGQRWCE